MLKITKEQEELILYSCELAVLEGQQGAVLQFLLPDIDALKMYNTGSTKLYAEDRAVTTLQANRQVIQNGMTALESYKITTPYKVVSYEEAYQYQLTNNIL